MSAEPKSRLPRATTQRAEPPPRAAPPRAAPSALASGPPLRRSSSSPAPSARPRPPSGQDFGFLRVAPPKQAPSSPPDPHDLFPPLESEIIPAKRPAPEAPRARTIRVAQSARPKLDATVVAKRIPPKR